MDIITVGAKHNPRDYHIQLGLFLVQFNAGYVAELDNDGDLARSQLQDWANEIGVNVAFPESNDPLYGRDRVTSEHLLIFSVPGIDNSSAAIQFADDLQSIDSQHAVSERVVPIYDLEEGTGIDRAVPFIDTFYLRLESGVSPYDIISRYDDHTLTFIHDESLLIAPYYALRFDHRTQASPLKSALELYELLLTDSDVHSVDLDWMLVDAYFSIWDTQVVPGSWWHLDEIRAESGWTATELDPPGRVAIVDSGFELNHEDIAFDTLNQFNATQFKAVGSLSTPAVYNAGPSGNPHGTAVAGIVAANHRNGVGVAGVAGTYQIVPIRVGPAPTAGKVASSIGWVRVHNVANIINLSLGVVATDALHVAITRAVHADILIVAAAGNLRAAAPDSPRISYPASRPDVIAVGAADKVLKRVGDSAAATWRSRYGDRLDVVAPGVDIRTTDESGDSGYQAGSYFDSGAGTSASCPQVAGLAALIRANRSDLYAADVREIIIRTCRKVGGYTYTPHEHTEHGWNERVGYGLINCQEALQEAENYVSEGSPGVVVPVIEEVSSMSSGWSEDKQAQVDELEGRAGVCGAGTKSLTGVHLQITRRTETLSDGSDGAECGIYRLYLNVEFSKWVEVNEDDVVERPIRWGYDRSPFGFVTVWVQPSARVVSGHAQPVSSFLRGRILAQRSAQPAMGTSEGTQPLTDLFLDPDSDEAYHSMGGPCG